MEKLVLFAQQQQQFSEVGLLVIAGFLAAFSGLLAAMHAVFWLTMPKRNVNRFLAIIDDKRIKMLASPQQEFLIQLFQMDAAEAERLLADQSFCKATADEMRFPLIKLKGTLGMCESRTNSLRHMTMAFGLCVAASLYLVVSSGLTPTGLIVWGSCAVVFGSIGAVLGWLLRPRNIWQAGSFFDI